MLLTVRPACAQPNANSFVPTVSGNVAMMRERAERGDTGSQLELADILSAQSLVAQSVVWYHTAAEHGNVQAKFRLGEILLHGAESAPDPKERVPANARVGVLWTYEAATNFHGGACRNMSYVLENGLGVKRDMVEAYAWLEVYARSNASDARTTLDRLALQMSLQEIREAHTVAALFTDGHWRGVNLQIVGGAESGPKFKLNGITLGPVPLAIINGQTMQEGDSTVIRGNEAPVRFNCLKIGPDSVQIAVEGEAGIRILRLR